MHPLSIKIFCNVRHLTATCVCFYHFNHLSHHTCLFFFIFVLIFVTLFLINCRLRNKGATKYLGESVTGVEISILNLHSGLCIAGKGNRLGTLADTQASSMTLLHMHKGFSHLNEEADNCDVIRWCHCCSTYKKEGGYIWKCAWALGVLLLLLVLFQFVCPGSHRPSVLATSVPLEEWDYHHTGKCSLFV